VQRGRIEYEGETSVYTQISPLKIRVKDEYILIFLGGKMSRRENEYVTAISVEFGYHLTLNLPGEGYSKNMWCRRNLISTFH
jgi:hypothetical protein